VVTFFLEHSVDENKKTCSVGNSERTRRRHWSIAICTWSKSDYMEELQWKNDFHIFMSLTLTFQWVMWPWGSTLKGQLIFRLLHVTFEMCRALSVAHIGRGLKFNKWMTRTFPCTLKGQLIFDWLVLPQSTCLPSLKCLAWSTSDHFCEWTDEQNHERTGILRDTPAHAHGLAVFADAWLVAG